jgi:segregation and condensation protein A
MDNTQVSEMEQHLLFHRALAEDVESFERIGEYTRILRDMTGERLSDPVDESIRAMFSLVIENGIDPWEIDLREFVRIYSRKVTDMSFDMILAGRFILMAWKILRMQSEATYEKGVDVRPEEEEISEFDFAFEDEDDRLAVPEVAFMRAFQRTDPRPVTMYELISAFEDARIEIEVRDERERTRSALRAKEPRRFDNKAHEEDDERDVVRVLERILGLGCGTVPLDELYTEDVMEDLRIFVSVLHLVRDGRLDIRQESLPHGRVLVEVPATAGTVG